MKTVSHVIFVFGSNLAGRHGKGAALHAKRYYGAKYRVGEGLTGNSYALPTKDEQLKTRSLTAIEGSMKTFCRFARQHPSKLFVLTPIGTGLAGYSRRQVTTLLGKFKWSKNVVLSMSWILW